MATDKLSISLAPDLAEAIRTAAERLHLSTSSWLAEAARERLRADALDEFLVKWQAENGAFTQAELDAADEMLGVNKKIGRGLTEVGQVLIGERAAVENIAWHTQLSNPSYRALVLVSDSQSLREIVSKARERGEDVTVLEVSEPTA